MFHQNSKLRLLVTKLLQDQYDTSHAVSEFEFFFQEYAGCHVVAPKSLFMRPKMERKYSFRQNLLAVSSSILTELQHTLLIKRMVDQKTMLGEQEEAKETTDEEKWRRRRSSPDQDFKSDSCMDGNIIFLKRLVGHQPQKRENKK